MNVGAGRGQGCPPSYESENYTSRSAMCCSGSLPEIMVSDAPAQYRDSLQQMFPFTKFNRMQVSHFLLCRNVRLTFSDL